MKSVLLGMSGGVDSSVAAALLKQEGYRVIGITMVLIPNNEEETVKDAKTVADFLGVEHRVLHLEEEFRDKVILPFIDSYQEGSTPNPCILCNEHFIPFPDGPGKSQVAAGHQAGQLFVHILPGRGCVDRRRQILPRLSLYGNNGPSGSFRRQKSLPLIRYDNRAGNLIHGHPNLSGHRTSAGFRLRILLAEGFHRNGLNPLGL